MAFFTLRFCAKPPTFIRISISHVSPGHTSSFVLSLLLFISSLPLSSTTLVLPSSLFPCGTFSVLVVRVFHFWVCTFLPVHVDMWPWVRGWGTPEAPIFPCCSLSFLYWCFLCRALSRLGYIGPFKWFSDCTSCQVPFPPPVSVLLLTECEHIFIKVLPFSSVDHALSPHPILRTRLARLG